ncbi:CTP synthase [Riemerella anatipestifer]|uniref:CTP synthase n=1 Tax=Riemerella anatipestifer (strain ATCC 11845 / DSM 15868 / JCM 9532 / NCTC 11014) TaxID=693978 RepID=E4TBP7_RIEAD|nr:CTP synthase [Riemerella anatipestifer]ADQ81944.1 CTP synthase [Riemerella anatipestifer ATCC 11845 = DSM 15868]AFD55949.1 CTP synthase [Riemerella anatipestifer ATCC 11845 = DSM 15868]MRM91462.1 CTP synthase [Riemerella anatipestifer]SNV57950.1 CTP synthase [Riemerella anatipestifer]
MSKKNTKYIFVTGGVTSSLGKGIISASLGLLLKSRGFKVTIQKLDPYINIDPGTLNPYEHGECYVTEDGAETDLDLGHYERFLDAPTSQNNNVTTGRIYQTVIEKERKGDFLGKTVQVIPHITNEIKRRIKILAQKNYDIIITEIGGTVGDIESLPYIESVRQLKWELGEHNSMVIHLTLLPYLAASGELKTKPSQHSVRQLMESGIQADVLVCRSEHKIPKDVRAKLAQFCNVPSDNVIECMDAETIYQVPIELQKQKFDEVVLKALDLKNDTEADLKSWKTFLKKYKNPKKSVEIALVGKYVSLQDSYKSIAEAFIHAGADLETEVNIRWVYSGDLEEGKVSEILKGVDAMLIAPGFGDRGIEGKILAAQYAREHKIPLLGICLGMQIMTIEFARNVLGYEKANSMEFDTTTAYPVISLMEEQKNVVEKGGTMRLGAWKCTLKSGSKLAEIYDSKNISERHRHRYEFNSEFKKDYEDRGLVPTGFNPDTGLVEALELNEHPFYIGVQYHPEYKSTVATPHPLFKALVKAAVEHKGK